MVQVGMCSCGHRMVDHDSCGCLICLDNHLCGKETAFPELMAGDQVTGLSLTPAGAGEAADRLPPSVPAEWDRYEINQPMIDLPVGRAASATEDSELSGESSGPARLAPIDPEGFAYFAWVRAEITYWKDPHQEEWDEWFVASSRELWELGPGWR